MGYKCNVLLSIVPFMVFAIGVDDSFLLLAGTRHSLSATAETKVADAMAVYGASVTALGGEYSDKCYILLLYPRKKLKTFNMMFLLES